MPRSDQPPPFADLDAAESDYETARAAVLPIPYERTTCWEKGTEHGPTAILEASHHLELWDEELEIEISSQGIATLPYLDPEHERKADALRAIRDGALEPMQDGDISFTNEALPQEPTEEPVEEEQTG